jgi:hypothetical protein
MSFAGHHQKGEAGAAIRDMVTRMAARAKSLVEPTLGF